MQPDYQLVFCLLLLLFAVVICFELHCACTSPKIQGVAQPQVKSVTPLTDSEQLITVDLGDVEVVLARSAERIDVIHTRPCTQKA